ncbi:MAG: replicative DNA helicase [Candidatus Lloydbacteria bacterium RIFCSPHIGHO2_01_FULL_41_20]|uniref:Replicative DNA helicase n=1 Tax=Candidatus Lloydbacteria bacterium RIFCSPHIGHO2_01_FULL_41_20 TaxID=1798657 RepID=A0A1G2CQW8_9BACT|nr:MAG: replicative DNA helicase [Candidatus Lloydbacteria bacterium RIFCSPHIGHO2_01_FULL_41_20]
MATKRTSANLRIPPQNIDSERALLGSIMLRPEAMHEVIEKVDENSFYVEKHRIIWKVMLELHNKNEPIDLLTLSSRLKEKKLLDSIGGNSYITELVNTVPSAANVSHYADIVNKKHVLRRLIETADNISESGFQEEHELETLLNEAEKNIFNITSSPRGHRFINIKEVLGEVWERIDKLHKKDGGLRGVSTGFPELDARLSGFQKSDLIILAARPSMGKTALALDIARKAALNHGVPVGIFSLEMSSQQLADRMVAAEARVDAWKLRTGGLKLEEDFKRIGDALSGLSKAPLFIDDEASNNIVKMRSVARRLKREHNIGLIIVDYLQLMTPTKNYDSMVNQVTEISRSLKGLARELDIPVLALSQLSRAVESRGGRPRLSDLRDSGSIEQDADVVMFIHREDKYKEDSDKPNIAEILIEKHRNGPTGKIELYFDDKKATFLSIEKTGMQDFAEDETF